MHTECDTRIDEKWQDKINDSKTEFLTTGTKQQLNSVDNKTNKLSVGNSVIRVVTAGRTLGVKYIFDENMTLIMQHINNPCKKDFYSIHNIKRIRKYLL